MHGQAHRGAEPQFCSTPCPIEHQARSAGTGCNRVSEEFTRTREVRAATFGPDGAIASQIQRINRRNFAGNLPDSGLEGRGQLRARGREGGGLLPQAAPDHDHDHQPGLPSTRNSHRGWAERSGDGTSLGLAISDAAVLLVRPGRWIKRRRWRR